MSFFVPTRFVWRFGGRAVYLCGSFTRWVETVPMAPVDNSPGVFAVVVHLPPGYHQYKFIVDGKWRHDETAPFMPDPLGNVNNWLFVRRSDPSPMQLPSDIPQGADKNAGGVPPAAAQGPGVPAMPPPAAIPQADASSAPAAAAPAPSTIPTAAGGGAGSPPRAPGAPMSPHLQHSIGPGAAGAGSGAPGVGPSTVPQPAPQPPPADDVDMTNVEATPTPPVIILDDKAPEFTRSKVHDFLSSHVAYELIPESTKVVALDVCLPMRQALHALCEQRVPSAALWDASTMSIVGVLSASDFLSALMQLRASVAAGAAPMSEAQMDEHSIAALRETAAVGAPAGVDAASHLTPRPLVYVKPDDSLMSVVTALVDQNCSMCPMLSCDPGCNGELPTLLHPCTLSGVLASLMRYFRASLASLPLLGQPLARQMLGTWSPDVVLADMEVVPDSTGRRQWRKMQPLHTVTPDTPLTAAMRLMLDAGVSCVPVVDEHRRLLDVYARADVTALCHHNTYARLQCEDITVGQALELGAAACSTTTPPTPPPAAGHSRQQAAMQSPVRMGGLSAELAASANASPAKASPQPAKRAHVCSKDDTLRSVVERLAVPGVRRLIVVAPDTHRVEGIVSLSDVARYLLM